MKSNVLEIVVDSFKDRMVVRVKLENIDHWSPAPNKIKTVVGKKPNSGMVTRIPWVNYGAATVVEKAIRPVPR